MPVATRRPSEPLTERDVSILLRLYRHRRLNTDQLIAWHCVAASNADRLRWRLATLRRRQLIRSSRPSIYEPYMHELSQAGMRLLTGRIPGLVSRRLPSPRRSGDARQARSLDVAAHRNRDHDLELSDFTLCLDHWAARHAPTTSILDEYALLERATDPRARKERGWPATASHQGETIDLWVKPDRFLGVHFADRPAGRDTRYFAIEYGTGSMPVEASHLRRASELRKLLAYRDTLQRDTLPALFGVAHLTVLFICRSEERCRHLRELAARVVPNRDLADHFLFGVKPARPTIETFPDVTALPFWTARGKAVRMRL